MLEESIQYRITGSQRGGNDQLWSFTKSAPEDGIIGNS